MRKPKIEISPEQQARLNRARRAADPTSAIEFTPEQRSALLQAAEREYAERAETIAQLRRIDKAASEPGISGQLRRAIESRIEDWSALAERAGLPRDSLFDFMEGLPVSSDVIDKLASAVGCQLAQTFPVESAPSPTSDLPPGDTIPPK